MFSQIESEKRLGGIINLRCAVRSVARFKIEASSLLIAAGLLTYSTVYGRPPDPAFRISYSCEENTMQRNRQPGKHIEITVKSDSTHESGSLAIYLTPHRLKRYNPQAPFPGSVTESLEVQKGFSRAQGEMTLVRVLSSSDSDTNQAINGRMIASALVPLTCE